MTKHKHVRAGGKFTKSHTTVIEAAGIVADIAHRCKAVSKISISVITPKRGAKGGGQRIKISREGHTIKVKVTDGAVHQVIFVYGNDFDQITTYISSEAAKAGLTVSTTP